MARDKPIQGRLRIHTRAWHRKSFSCPASLAKSWVPWLVENRGPAEQSAGTYEACTSTYSYMLVLRNSIHSRRRPSNRRGHLDGGPGTSAKTPMDMGPWCQVPADAHLSPGLAYLPTYVSTMYSGVLRIATHRPRDPTQGPLRFALQPGERPRREPRSALSHPPVGFWLPRNPCWAGPTRRAEGGRGEGGRKSRGKVGGGLAPLIFVWMGRIARCRDARTSSTT